MASEIKDYSSKAFLAKQGKDFDELEPHFEASVQAFIQALAQLDDQAFYRPIARGKWTAAEIADHIIRSQDVFAGAMAAVLADEPVLVMPKGYLSEEGQPVSPENQAPIPRRARADLSKELLSSYTQLKGLANQAAQKGQLERPCMVHAFLGELSIFEALQLSCWHIRHHRKQLPLS